MKPTNDIAGFCDQHCACAEGREWALSSCKDMAEAWDKAKPEWLIWIATRNGVLDDKTLRLFACWCVRQVWSLLTDERSLKAVEVAEKYANGEATGAELSAASAAAWAAARAASAAASAAAWDAAWAAARAAQSSYLREIGNPFKCAAGDTAAGQNTRGGRGNDGMYRGECHGHRVHRPSHQA